MLLTDPYERDDRLARLGTSQAILEKALRRGEVGWRRATEDHGVDAPSQYAYRERLAALRSGQKVHRGWENARLLQIELTVNPEHTVAFQTLTGNQNTGDPRATPRNKHPRGPNGQRLLTSDDQGDQLALFPDLAPAPDTVELEDHEDLEVWVFLVHRVDEPDEGRAFWHSELSRPHRPDARGYITGWHERILLPTLEIGAVVLPGDDEGPDGLDIPINFR